MHCRISAHHLCCHQRQKVPQQRQTIADERLAKDNGKYAQEHGVPGVAIQTLDHQAPAQQDSHLMLMFMI
jgi:hypothetical protein